MNRDYIGYVIAVISIITGGYVSNYYYEKSIQTKQPIFMADYFPQTIYDVKQELSVPLKVTKNDGSTLTKSVHVATLTFLNSGNIPVTNQDTLTPIKISSTDESFEILAVSIIKQSRKVVDCSTSPDGLKSFTISFRILEQNDGCLIRIFYSGAQSVKYSVAGDIVGVKEIEVRNETVWDLLGTEQKNNDLLKSALSNAPRIILWLAIAILALLYINSTNMDRAKFIKFCTFLLLIGALVFISDELRYKSYSIKSPPKIDTKGWITPDAP